MSKHYISLLSIRAISTLASINVSATAARGR